MLQLNLNLTQSFQRFNQYLKCVSNFLEKLLHITYTTPALWEILDYLDILDITEVLDFMDILHVLAIRDFVDGTLAKSSDWVCNTLEKPTQVQDIKFPRKGPQIKLA